MFAEQEPARTQQHQQLTARVSTVVSFCWLSASFSVQKCY